MDNRNYSLDIIKIVATIIIVFHHYQQIFETTFPTGLNYYDGKFNFAYIVELFFILSGYFLYNYIKRINSGLGFDTFITSKLKRLLPMLTISAIGYEIVVVWGSYCGAQYISQNSIHVVIWGLVTSSLGIQEGWGITDYWVNHPIWYVSVLIWCYVLFFFVTWLARRIKTSPEKFYIFIIILGIGMKSYNISLPFLNTQMYRGYISVFTGVLLASLVDKRIIDITSWKIQITSTGIIASGLYCFINKYSWILEGLPYLLTLFFFPAIIILAQNPLFKKTLHYSWIGTLGKIMFDVYVWHNTVLLSIRCMKDLDWISFDTTQRRWMYLVWIITLLVGTISYYLVEVPINKRINKNTIKAQ